MKTETGYCPFIYLKGGVVRDPSVFRPWCSLVL